MTAKPNRQARRKQAKDIQTAVRKDGLPQPERQGKANVFETIVKLRKQAEALSGSMMKLNSTYENIILAYDGENREIGAELEKLKKENTDG